MLTTVVSIWTGLLLLSRWLQTLSSVFIVVLLWLVWCCAWTVRTEHYWLWNKHQQNIIH